MNEVPGSVVPSPDSKSHQSNSSLGNFCCICRTASLKPLIVKRHFIVRSPPTIFQVHTHRVSTQFRACFRSIRLKHFRLLKAVSSPCFPCATLTACCTSSALDKLSNDFTGTRRQPNIKDEASKHSFLVCIGRCSTCTFSSFSVCISGWRGAMSTHLCPTRNM